MPSALSDFNTNNQQLSLRLTADLTKSGSFSDFTNNVDNITLLQKTDKVFGIYDAEFHSDLYFDAINNPPSGNWALRGRDIKVYISTTGDNWATSYEHTFFTGSTDRQNSIAVDKLQIKATSLNSDYLDRTLGRYAPAISYTVGDSSISLDRRFYVSSDISDIMTDLLTAVGVPTSQVSLTATGIVLDAYTVSDSVPIRDYINDLAVASGQLVGFDRDGVFRATSINRLTLTASTLTSETTFDLSTQSDYEVRQIQDKFYCNTFSIKGRFARFINWVVGSEPLFFNGDITGFSIASGKTAFYTVEDDNLIPIWIADVANPSQITSEYYQPVYINSGTAPVGNASFFNTDDRSTGTLQTDVAIESVFIADENGKSKPVIKFKNNGGSTRYLKDLTLFGLGIRLGGDIAINREFKNLIDNDGKVISQEYDSLAIQSSGQASNLANSIQLNFAQQSNTYKFKIVGYPSLKVGSIISFRDSPITNIQRQGIILEMDEEIGDGYDAILTVKAIDTSKRYFIIGTSTIGGSDPIF